LEVRQHSSEKVGFAARLHVFEVADSNAIHEFGIVHGLLLDRSFGSGSFREARIHRWSLKRSAENRSRLAFQNHPENPEFFSPAIL
jgi:hypothetical protein